MLRLAFFLLLLWGCAWAEESAKSKIVVASKTMTESRILAEMMALILEQEGYDVERRLGLGGTMICFSAMERGQIDVYPEYTGTAWTTILAESAPLSDPLQAFLKVRSEFRRRYQIDWLSPFGFSNSYALAMTEAEAKKFGLERLSQLGPQASKLRAGFSHEFLSRTDGYAGLARAYRFEFGDVRGMQHNLIYQAVAAGQTDIVDAYTTDAKLLHYKLRVLKDDLGFFPPYQAAPMIRMDTLKKNPGLAACLERLAFEIDAPTMTQLNYEVEQDGRGFQAVAADFLTRKGLLRVGERQQEIRRNQGFWQLLWDRRQITSFLAWQHVQLTLVSVILAGAFAVPLGVLIHRIPRLAPPVLGLIGVLQTVPSIALLACLITIPGLGLGVRSAVVALFLYALLPIVRNTYTGLCQVDPQLREAAIGQGLTPNQVLIHLELPLATATILAGLRTSAVINVGVATLAAFVGAGGLGDPIVTGLQLNDTHLILTGAVPSAMLALLVDALFGLSEKVLIPRGLR